jgi:hypothetical protein
MEKWKNPSIFDKNYVKPLPNVYVTVSLWFQIGSDFCIQFVGTFENFRKASISFGMSLCPCVRPSIHPPARENPAPIGRIFMKFDISVFFFSKIFLENSSFIKI